MQLRVGAPFYSMAAHQGSRAPAFAVEPALRQVSYARYAQGSTGDCDHPPPCNSMQAFFVSKSRRGSTGRRLHLLLLL